MLLDALITNAGIQTKIRTDLFATIFGELFRYFTFGIVQITKQHRAMFSLATGFNAGGCAITINPVNTHGAGFNGALTSWCMYFLIFDFFMFE